MRHVESNHKSLKLLIHSDAFFQTIQSASNSLVATDSAALDSALHVSHPQYQMVWSVFQTVLVVELVGTYVCAVKSVGASTCDSTGIVVRR